MGSRSSPVWIPAQFLEIDCRNAGLLLSAPQPANTDGLFWDSRNGAYHVGIQGGGGLTQGIVRALVEGRIAYVEVPSEPIKNPKRIINQKVYVSSRAIAGSLCLDGAIGATFGQLPGKYCVASQIVENMNTRYELVGHLGADKDGTKLSIKDRTTGSTIGRYSFVKSTYVNPTLLALFGIASMQPSSCRPVMTDSQPALFLVEMVFPHLDGSRPDPSKLGEHFLSPWRVHISVAPEVAIPEGRAGIEYLIAKGKVRRLTENDYDLWRSTRTRRTYVPHNVFFINEPIFCQTIYLVAIV